MKAGIVIIGRNEAANLPAAIASLPTGLPVVYADSASSDDSPRIARAAGVDTVALSSPPALSASRGRNAGFARLQAIAPDIDAVQMIDGDCTLAPGWIAAGLATLESDATIGVVIGVLEERHPQASLYNRLCAHEWRIVPGEATTLGGIALIRVSALAPAKGYDESLVAGEEPDLCLRLRQAGWRIMAIDHPMADHDADLLGFADWWRRTRRGGFAFAALVARHGMRADRGWVRQLASIAFWGGLVPLAAIGGLLACWPAGLAFAGLWMLQGARMASRETKSGVTRRTALEIGAMTMTGKFAQLAGIGRWLAGWKP